MSAFFAATEYPDAVAAEQCFINRHAVLRSWGEFQETHPLIVAPIATDIPFPAGTDLDDGRVAETIRTMRVAMAINKPGLPAAAVPVGIDDGLPQAVQVIGPRYREDLCLGAAAALEDRLCVLEAEAVEVPEDVDPAEVVGLVLTCMTAYQLLHRMAKVKDGESVLVDGAAGRVGTAVLELGALAGLRLYGTCSAGDRAAVERLGAVPIDPQRGLRGAGARAPREWCGRGARWARWRPVASLVPCAAAGWKACRVRRLRHARGRSQELARVDRVVCRDSDGRSLGLLSPRRRVLAYGIQRLRDSRQWLPVAGRRPARLVGGPRDPHWFREDYGVLLELLRANKIHPVVAERLTLTDARRAHEPPGQRCCQTDFGLHVPPRC